MQAVESLYQEKIALYESTIRIARKKLNRIAIFRMMIFVILAACVYFYFKNHETFFLYGTLISLVIFIVIIRINFNIRDKKLLDEQLLFVNNNEMGLQHHQRNQFENGQQFYTHEKYFADLDIFGERSVFHLLNRTTTSHGRENLANALKRPLRTKQDIEQYQDAVKVLSRDFEKRQLLTANGLLHNEKEGTMHSISDWLNTDNKLQEKKWILIARWVLPIINLIALFYFFVNDTGYYYLPILITGGCSWLLLGVFSKYISSQHLLISKKEKVLDQYKAILQVFNTVDSGRSEYLKTLHKSSIDAADSIHRLARLSQVFDQRLNLIISLFGNTIFLYDIHAMISLEKWKTKNKAQFPQWINCVGSIEYINSMACFAFNNTDYVYPLVSGDKITIEAKQVAHPLIAKEKRVANDFVLGENEKIKLITGSNMSGKTTFLRTIGVNLLLAQCGSPVCATSFVFTPMMLLSSIRISDSLQENTSYFMAELKRLQEIITELQKNAPALVLIDEILRGTNSEDKTHGSEQFIKKLLQYNCICLFATHDLNLGALEQELPGKISNYCFESIIREHELFFDYTLQKGIAKNKNASFLMEKMDII
ncbi:MAG: hypothetical protein JST75_17685 [Bacteroidetes bacterium]|nr:hypothetical protein [Bacteroidota bacterium]